MELKLWVPNFLRIDSNFKIVWSGGILPPGTLLYPYQTPILQNIQLNGLEEIPINLQEVCYKNNPYFMQKKDCPEKSRNKVRSLKTIEKNSLSPVPSD